MSPKSPRSTGRATRRVWRVTSISVYRCWSPGRRCASWINHWKVSRECSEVWPARHQSQLCRATVVNSQLTFSLPPLPPSMSLIVYFHNAPQSGQATEEESSSCGSNLSCRCRSRSGRIVRILRRPELVTRISRQIGKHCTHLAVRAARLNSISV